jgi:tRNA threonylcarbamoyladenosine biosynthesis protein TsaB
LTSDGRLLTESLLDAPGGLQTALLMPELQRLLRLNKLAADRIDLFSCSIGPGSFTGIRTGIAATQGLALATNKLCVGVSTLAMLAMNLPFASCQVCPMLDARKNEVYTALYRVTDRPVAVVADCAIAPADFLEMVTEPTIFLGDGALRYRDLIHQKLGDNAYFAPLTHHVPRPSSGCLLAEDACARNSMVAPEMLLPTYLRLSEAELSHQQNS